MKTENDLLSQANWLENFVSKIQQINTDGKLKHETALWGICLDYTWNRCEVYNGYHRLMEKSDAMERIADGTTFNKLSVYVCTTEKGNYYGVHNSTVHNRPELASLFRKRVRGASKMVFTDSIDNVRKFLHIQSDNITKFDVMPENDNDYFGVFTTYDIAQNAASILHKIHKNKTRIKWYDAKNEDLKSTLSAYLNSIESLKQNILQLEEKIDNIKNEIAENEQEKSLIA